MLEMNNTVHIPDDIVANLIVHLDHHELTVLFHSDVLGIEATDIIDAQAFVDQCAYLSRPHLGQALSAVQAFQCFLNGQVIDVGGPDFYHQGQQSAEEQRDDHHGQRAAALQLQTYRSVVIHSFTSSE